MRKQDIAYIKENGFWVLIGAIISFIGGFALSVAFANLLSQETYGEYKYIFSLMGMLGAITLSGSGIVISRSITKGFDGTFLNQVKLQIKTSFPAVAMGLGVGFYYLYQGNSTLGYGIVIASIFSPLLQSLNLYNSVLEGKRLFKTITLFQSIHGSLPIVVVIGSLYVFDNLIPILLTYFISHIVIHGILTFVTRTLYIENQNVDPEARSYSLHLSLQGVIGPISSNLDKILVFQFFGSATLATYAIATAIPQQFNIIRKGVRSLLFPKVNQGSLHSLKEGFLVNSLTLLCAGTVIFLIYYFTAPYIFKIFFPKYLEAVNLSQYFALTLVFIPTIFFSVILYSQKMTRELYVSKISVALIRILLLIIFTRTYGIYGAITALILTQIVETFQLLYFVIKRLRTTIEQ